MIGCLFCRKSGQILFFLNGRPTWQVHCPEIVLLETTANLSPRGDRERYRSGDMERQRRGSVASNANAAAQDMFVTIGVLGKGELEINFGGKNFNLAGEISKVSKGAVQSTAPIAARAFGYRLARFHVMLVRSREEEGVRACSRAPLLPMNSIEKILSTQPPRWSRETLSHRCAVRVMGASSPPHHIDFTIERWWHGMSMQDELKLFYACFNPPMVPKAKGMVVLNISRQEVGHTYKLFKEYTVPLCRSVLRHSPLPVLFVVQDFNAELKEAYGKDLSDVSQHARESEKCLHPIHPLNCKSNP